MDPPTRIFISYSHDSDAHRQRVLALSERLRRDGIETILDRYVEGSPPQGWPRWMLDGLDAADRVLVICTGTYYRRFRGHEVPSRGKGADWEGAIVTQALYDARSATTRFVPVLLDPADADQVPEPLRAQTRYCLQTEADYQALCDAILSQSGIEPAPLGAPKRKPRRHAEPLTLPGAAPPPAPPALAPTPQRGSAAPAPRVDLAHLPAGAAHFLGRGGELAALDAVWSDGDRTSVVELIAPGGTGKTAVVKRWLEQIRAQV